MPTAQAIPPPMRPFSLLIKPAAADCNLRCEYCFYLDTARLYPATPRHRMPDAVLERLIRSYLATPQALHSFGWQGGEPTLMGPDFFRRVTDLQQQHGRDGTVVANGLQTNATLITDELAAHFARYHFLLGCSLDGPAALHDRYRRTLAGGGSHADVMRGLAVLRRWQVECNILVLVSQANVRCVREVYRYLTNEGFLYLQFIPCVEFDAAGGPQPYAITGPEWGDFLCALFDEWHPADVHRVSIRHFDSILARIVDGQANVCTLGRNCCQYLLVEHNGDVYPCDFFVRPELRIGNLMQMTWSAALSAPVYRAFGAQKARWHKTCSACEFLPLCRGDCLKHRRYAGPPASHLSWLCVGWRQLLAHARERFEALAQQVRARRALEARLQRPAAPPPAGGSRPERNAPCPCGSGLKFKKCCGRTPV